MVPSQAVSLTKGLHMGRPQKSILNLELNGFKVVSLLSDTESTTGNFQPEYLVRCISCQKELKRTKRGLLKIKPCRCGIPKPERTSKVAAPTISPIQPDARLISKHQLRKLTDTDGHKSPATPDGTLLYLYPGHPSYRLGRKPKPVQKEPKP